MNTLPDSEQMPLIALIQRIGDYGPAANPQKFKQLRGHGSGLLELKSYQHRIFCFEGVEDPDGKPTLIMTNAFRKKQRRTPLTEIQRANRAKAVYEEDRQPER